VLAQTYSNLELLVVVDGPDTATANCLAEINHPRLRILSLPQNVGLGDARNAGVRESSSDWVAFLDDDDEWFSEKIATQVRAALKAGDGVNFVASRFEEHSEYGVRLRPKVFPAPGALWSESFYCEKILLLPSTFLVKRSLMVVHPFTLRRHEDADWLLRGQAKNVFRAVWVEQALTIYHCESAENRLSTEVAWRGRYEWWQNNPTLLTPKAVPFYVGMICIPEAKRSPAPFRSCIFLLGEALKKGKISLRAMVYLAVVTLTSMQWRSKHRSRRNVLRTSDLVTGPR
jgi:glycosyltransferase involved in cell wall biosynthesis